MPMNILKFCGIIPQMLLTIPVLTLVTFTSFGSDTIYLNSKMAQVNQLDSAVYFHITQRSDSVPAIVNQRTCKLDGSLVMDVNFLVTILKNPQLSPEPPPDEKSSGITAFRRTVGNEMWDYHGDFYMWWDNGTLKRHDIYDNGILLHGRIWNEDGTGAKYHPYMVDASFPGGMPKLLSFLQSNLKYPRRARREGAEGIVVVSFVVEKDGRLSQPIVAQSVHPKLDREALRVTNQMPLWEPALMDGKPVRMQFYLPVRFVLN